MKLHHLKTLVNVGSIDSKLLILIWKTRLRENHEKIEVAVLQALLEEDSTQTQSQLAEILNVIQKSVGERLHEIWIYFSFVLYIKKRFDNIKSGSTS